MLSIPDTYPNDLAPLKSTLTMPYTLTPGRATGAFLAEIGGHRIVGSRFKSGRVIAPAQDFCPMSGDDQPELVVVPPTGVLTAFTRTASGIIGLIKLDGCDNDFAHRIVGAALDTLSPGLRVEAVWADGVATSVLAIEGFRPTAEALVGTVTPLTDPAPAVEVVPYTLSLHYEHAFGPYYGRLFDEIRSSRKIMGVRTTDGDRALLPPRELDDVSHKKTGTWKEVAHTGTVRACSVIHLEFIGQTRKPPYIYAEITLDGAATRLIHTVAGFDMAQAKELVKPGTRVRAVWSEQRTGSLSTDISHFELLDE